MAATIILKATFGSKTAFKSCIKQCIVLERTFCCTRSVWFSIMTPHHNNEKKMATKMATIIII